MGFYRDQIRSEQYDDGVREAARRMSCVLMRDIDLLAQAVDNYLGYQPEVTSRINKLVAAIKMAVDQESRDKYKEMTHGQDTV